MSKPQPDRTPEIRERLRQAISLLEIAAPDTMTADDLSSAVGIQHRETKVWRSVVSELERLECVQKVEDAFRFRRGVPVPEIQPADVEKPLRKVRLEPRPHDVLMKEALAILQEDPGEYVSAYRLRLAIKCTTTAWVAVAEALRAHKRVKQDGSGSKSRYRWTGR